MSKEFTLSYCTNDIHDKILTIKLHPSTTCQDFIKILSEKENKIYNSVFYEGSEIDHQDLIFDYFTGDPNCILVASASSESPNFKLPKHNICPNSDDISSDCPQMQENYSQSTKSSDSDKFSLYKLNESDFEKDRGKPKVIPMTFDYLIHKNTHLHCISQRNQQVYDDHFNKLLELYTTLQHPVLPPFIGYYPYFKKVRSVFELKGKDSLRSNFKIQNPLFDNTHKFIILYGISCAIEYLHSHNVIYHYINPEDIFLDSNYYPYLHYYLNPTLCSNDSEDIENLSKFDHIIFAPEFFHDFQKFKENPCIDVFSFALLILTTFTGNLPFNLTSLHQISTRLLNKNRPDIPDSIPENWKRLIIDCWNDDPEKRPTFTQICDILESDVFVNEDINKDEFLKYKDIVKPFRPSLNNSK